MVDIGTAWDFGNRTDSHSWLVEAAQILLGDAQRQGVSNDARARIANFVRDVSYTSPDNATPDQVANLARVYEALRAELGVYAYAAPPIDVVIPTLATGSHPPEIQADQWPRLAHAAETLPSSDGLRAAVHHWSTWARTAPQTLPADQQALLEHAADLIPGAQRSTVAALRSRRLAAWVDGRLSQHPATALPSPHATTPDSTVPAAAQSGGGMSSIFKFFLGGLILGAMSKRRR